MDKLKDILWEIFMVEDDVIGHKPPKERDTSKLIAILNMLLKVEEIKQQNREVMAKS